MCAVCTSAPMRREIYSIKILCVSEGFLLHKYEIMKLNGKIAEKGYTPGASQVYFKGSLVKVEGWAWPVVRSSTTSGQTLPRRTREGNWKRNLR